MSNFEALNYFQKIFYVAQNINFSLSTIGIIGNLLVILVFGRQALRKFSYSFYSEAKAIVDLIFLLFSVKNWTGSILGYNLDLTNQFFCSISLYIPYSLMIANVWLIALISLDRLITVVYPNRFRFLKKNRVQIVLVVGVLLFSFSSLIQTAINMRFVVFGSAVSCSPKPDVYVLANWILVGNIIGVVVFLNGPLNLKLIWHILASRKRVTMSLAAQKTKSSSKDRKLAMTSIVLNFIALVCRLPLGALTVYSFMSGAAIDQTRAVLSITGVLVAIECADAFFVNFFLNSLFRKELQLIVRLNRDSNSLSNSNSIGFLSTKRQL